MASRATIAAVEMRVGDEGFCLLGCRLRGARRLRKVPRGPRRRFHGPLPRARSGHLLRAIVDGQGTRQVGRLDEGFAIRLPPGEVPSRYLPQAAPDSLPIIAFE